MGGTAENLFVLRTGSGSAVDMGFKGYNLARLARLGLPVPDGFVLGTALCRDWLNDPEEAKIAARSMIESALRDLERASGLRFGDARRPLLVSVRSGAPVSMPGMMDTLLDVGLNSATLRGVLRLTGNPRLAWDSYRRLVQSFAETVHGADPAPFRDAIERALRRDGLAQARELDFRALAALTEEFLQLHEDLTGKRFPQDPRTQLEAAVGAVFRSWRSERARAYRAMHNVAEDLGTAVTVQRMVFGNAGGTSGSGVAFTRDPATGDNRLYVDFLFNSQGEDVVSGLHRADDATRMAQVLPEAWRDLVAARPLLEREFGDAQEIEFTVQEGKLYLLQTRAAKRTPWAALRIAVDQVREGLMERNVALERIAQLDPERIARTRLAADEGAEALVTATSAGVGVASGRIALDAAAVRHHVERGARAILVREDLSTDDIAAINLAAGVLCRRGSRTSHAAVIARQLGKVCLVGCEDMVIDRQQRTARIAGRLLAEGAMISLDGNEGGVYAGEVRAIVERPEESLAEIARWRNTGLVAAG